MSLKSILAVIGHFFENLFVGAKTEFEKLPADQQQNVIDGSMIPQIIKNNLTAGETQITGLIIQKTGFSADIVNALLSNLYAEFNVKTLAEYQAILAAAQGSVWKGILETSAKILAGILSKGALTWESLGLGLLQYAYQTFISGK